MDGSLGHVRDTAQTGVAYRDAHRIDRILALLAHRQHGVVTIEQLRELGFTTSAATARARSGRLHRVHRGVYAVGHGSLSWHGHAAAAVLAVGGDAALTGASAAWIRGISRHAPARVEVVSTRRHRPLPGVDVRFTRSFAARDVTTRHRIRTATVPRLLVDLADRASSAQLVNLMHEAEFRGQLNLREVDRCAERHRTRHGHPTLRAALVMYRAGSAGTMSRLEERFLCAILELGAPAPEVNVALEVPSATTRELIRCDFHWPSARLCVEVDGPGHDRPRVRRQDLRRDELLRGAGWRVVRVRHDALRAGVRLVLDHLAECA